MLTKLINLFKSNKDDLILLAGIILIALASFGLGRLTAPNPPTEPITIEKIK
ncbi:MAG: hypothetical protein HYV52_00285 [Parcubacteria group bacterium]|nr:hypothetical protein [Parcubacteria group bacterium]